MAKPVEEAQILEGKILEQYLNQGFKKLNSVKTGAIGSICRIWTLENCIADAQKYKGRGEWSHKSPSAYVSAKKNNWLHLCTAHMEYQKTPDGYWTLERCKEDALKYNGRKEWAKNSPAAVDAAHDNGWKDECCAHMKRLKVPISTYTKEEVLATALKYKSRNEWHKNSNGTLRAAKLNGWYEIATSHMKFSERKINNGVTFSNGFR